MQRFCTSFFFFPIAPSDCVFKTNSRQGHGETGDARAVPRFAELNTSAWWAAGLWWGFTSFKKVTRRGGSLVGGEKTSYSAFLNSSWGTKTRNYTCAFCDAFLPPFLLPQPQTASPNHPTNVNATTTVCRPAAIVSLIFVWQNQTQNWLYILFWGRAPLLVTVVCRRTTILANSTVREVVSSCSTSVTCLIAWLPAFPSSCVQRPFCLHRLALPL